MDYLADSINHWIDNHSVEELDSIPWMNPRLRNEEITFWIKKGIIDNNLKRTNLDINRRLIFLDVDGVLNHADSNDAIDEACLRNLQTIINKTDAVLILVSSWKCGWFKENKVMQDDDANYLDSRLKTVGISIFDKSSRYASGRLLEVVDWIMRFNASSFVILDDDFGHYKDTPLEAFCIRTNYYENGLTEELAKEAITKLLQH